MSRTQVEPSHYFSTSYETKERFASYWHQVNEVTKMGFLSILEIGVGSGFLSGYLSKKGYAITSLDIDSRLCPDITASIKNLPISDESFDIIACFEVLEHIPYSDFCANLHELRRVAKKYVTLSIPDASHVFPIFVRVPFLGNFRKLITVQIKPHVHKFKGEHYWEIGKAGYSLSKITADIIKCGFIVEKTYRVFEMPGHRFFFLRKK